MKPRFTRFGPARAVRQRERLLILGGGTVILALVAIVCTLLIQQNSLDAATPVAASEIADQITFGEVVLIAPAAEVTPGMQLNKVPLRKVSWPRDKVPEGAIRDEHVIQEMFAKARLMANQPILRSDLSAAPLSAGGIVDLLPPGHRAVTVDVDATAGVDGWATPGAHVDVLLTHLDSSKGTNVTLVAVEDAIVMSFDGSTKSVANARAEQKTLIGGYSQHMRESTVTLAVSFNDALKLQTARAMGRISLALRNSSDVKANGASRFEAGQFDNAAPARRQEPVNGFVRFKDGNGNDRNLVLRADKTWMETVDDGS